MPLQLSDVGLHTDTHKTHNPENLTKVKTLLDSVGPGFCMAKWNQVTLHLGTGMTHSCHHPNPHPIPLEEIQANPAALHNTLFKKARRKEMLNGERPAECDYCWRVEDAGEGSAESNFSDRQSKSIEPWALPHFDTVSKMTGDEDVYPTYLEVSFSHVCNLKCAYCGPEYSTKWVDEINQSGPIKVLEGFSGLGEAMTEQWVQGWQDMPSLAVKSRDTNPYIDAFWKWWPEAYKHLKVYRITGGEPLMSKETFRSMDYLIDNPNEELEFAINSNLSVAESLWVKFIERAEKIARSGCVKKFTVFTSVEGWGERAEYARSGLDFELLRTRFEQLLQIGNIRVVIMSAYNIFSVTSFKQLLEWVHEMKIKYNPNNTALPMEQRSGFVITDGSTLQERKTHNPSHSIVVGIDIPYLRSPEFLDAQFTSHQLFEDYMIPTMNYIATHVPHHEWADHQGFEPYEADKFRRIAVHRMYYNQKSSTTREKGDDLKANRAKFYDYVNQLDARRGTNFLQTFPEMAEFFAMCKAAKDELTTRLTAAA